MQGLKYLFKFAFKSLKGEFLLRSYMIGFLYAYIIINEALQHFNDVDDLLVIVYTVISFILFPFAKFLWLRFKFFALNASTIYQRYGIINIVAKFIFNLVLFMFSIFIFPFALLVLHLDIKNK